MSQYSFPLLSEREISVSLGELGMTVGPDHFAKPTYELVQPVYENLVAVLMGLSRCGGVSGEGCGRATTCVAGAMRTLFVFIQ